MTLEITVAEIAADTAINHAQGVVHRLLALGQSAVPALLEILEDAVSAAIEPMLRVLAGTEANDRLPHDKIIQALPKMGAAATEPAIRAFTNNTDPKFRYSISTALAECQILDDRIFEILVDQLRREPSYGASNLATGVCSDLNAAAGHLVLMYGTLKNHRILEHLAGPPYSCELERKFTDRPALVARYRRNLDGFARFLRERGELPNEDG